MREEQEYFDHTGTLQGVPPCVAFFEVEHVHCLYSNFPASILMSLSQPIRRDEAPAVGSDQGRFSLL
jgi:hypothetical protein